MNSTTQESGRISRAGRWARLLADLALLAAGLIQVALFWAAQNKEDALICYRYAQNWVRGEGLVYSSGEYVEGYSNLLWTALLALLNWAGMSLHTADNVLIFFSTASALIILRWVSLRAFGDTWLARFPLFLYVCMTAVPISYGNGLEGSGVGMAAMLMLAGAFALRPWVLTAGAVMLLLLRPEGFAYAGWGMLWLLAGAYHDPVRRRKALACAAVTAGAFVALTSFRLAYYGDYIPNTVRAKGGEYNQTVLLAGVNYLFSYARCIGPVTLALALVAAFVKQWRGLWLLAAGLVGGNMAVVGANAGDWMGHFRLLTPFFALIAFLAAVGLAVVGGRNRKLGFALALAGLIGGAWTVLPHEIANTLRGVPARLSMIGQVPGGFNTLFDPHVSLRDVGEPDDRWLVEHGGWPGFALEGIRATEMWGLTDREIATGSGPGTFHGVVAGRICWPAAFAKDPTYMEFWDGAFYRRISTIAATPGLSEVISRYMVVQDRAIDAPWSMFNLFVARCDRKPMAKFVLHYGALAPAMDYSLPEFNSFQSDGNGPGTAPGMDGPLRTAWQKTGWTDASGTQIPTGWVEWDDDVRLSSSLFLERGVSRFTRDIPDDSPLVFVLGRFPLLVPRLKFRVIAVDAAGRETEVAHTEASDPVSGEFILTTLAVPGWGGASPVHVAVELEADAPCGVFLAAHRWAREPLPELPSRFVADTRLPRTVAFQVPDTPDADAALARQRAALEADPGSLENQFALAAALARAGDWAAAEPRLRRVLSLDRGAWAAGAMLCTQTAEQRRAAGDLRGMVGPLAMMRLLEPDNFEHAMLLGGTLETLGDTAAALEQYGAIVLALPESPKSAARIDAIFLAQKDISGRVALWRGMVERQPKARVPRLRLAAALADAGETGPAIDAYRGLLAEAPEDSEARLNLVRLLADIGDTAGALEALGALSSVRAGGENAAAAALDRIAETLIKRSETQAAAGVLRKSAALEPGNFEHAMLLAGVLEQLGDGGGALEQYRTVMLALPESPKSAERIDAIYAARGDGQGRVAEWRGMVAHDPKARTPRLRLAAALADAGETAAAVDAYRALVAEAADDSGAQLGLADALARAGDTAAALDTLRALAPPKAGQESAGAAMLDRMAETLAKRSETRAAAEVLRKSAALEPGNFQHAMLLAGVLEQLGDSDGALEQYRTVVLALPESPRCSERIDAIHAARGDAAARAAEWRAIAEKHPDAVNPWQRLADALEQAGDRDGASGARERAVTNAGKTGA